MAFGDVAVGFFFLSQTVLGILGNSALLFCLIVADFCGNRTKKPTDLIVKHLTTANFIVLCKGIPQTITTFSQTHHIDYASCSLTLYIHRVARGVSLGSTSLMSVFQAITISPSNSMWAQFKVRAPRIIGPSLGLCWSLQILVNLIIPWYTTDIRGQRNITGIKDLGYCVIINTERQIGIVTIILHIFNDVIFMGMMMWASSYMVFILFNHKARVQHIHSSLSFKSSPETRATQSILILVSCFVLFYIVSIVFTAYLSLQDVVTKWLSNTGVAMSACFPAFCPFLLIRHYTSLFRICCTCSFQTVIYPPVA
ncbi:vomeronasal type-1 receptor 4-like [Microtus oregoni]|uniref:vomeronasal type-1 receptor 4-like n=1 Tax=Microtus oregoni TaxID=111838 RepID=UPI001BB10859|nr:vomeronasal type-1 receptor 4-like [Microtus oregoni]